MVLYLKIQAADKPGDDLITRSKICRRPHLVYSPFFFHLLRLIYPYMKKFRPLHHMRQLKYDRQGKPQRNMHTDEPDSPGSPAYTIHRQSDIKNSIQQLAKPEYKVFPEIHFGKGRRDDLS